MKTKLVRITRTIMLQAVISMEVPEHVSTESIEECLKDQAELFEEIDGDTDRYEASINDESFDVMETDAQLRRHYPFSAVEVALCADLGL